MDEAVSAKIRGLLAIAKPTEAQVDGILGGWQRLFDALGLDERRQMAEFDAIMRARVQSGSVSVVAPNRLTENGPEF